MKALVFDGQSARLVDRPPPRREPGTAIVRVSRAGICNTDLELVQGYMGFRGVLGHELVGTVVEGPNDWVGRRVVAEINFGCGTCAACTRGMRRHCPERRVLGILDADGAFAELVAVPIDNLHAVPDGVPDEAAVFAEPLAAAFEILEQVHVEPGASALVFGDGKLGMLVAQVLARAGACVTVIGKYPEKLEILRRRGIGTALAGGHGGPPHSISGAPESSWDLVVEATGTAEGFGLAVQATRPRGTLVLKSTVAAETRVHLAPLVINEITVVGSRCGPFAPALRALQSGGVDVQSLVSATYDLQEAEAALQRAAEPGVLKVLLRND